MPSSLLSPDVQLESLEVGASPLVKHFLDRLNLTDLFTQYLPEQRGRPSAVSSASALVALIHTILIDRRPLYAVPNWIARRVPQHLGLLPEQVAALNDDRLGRALEHLHKADRASLLVALVMHTVREFQIEMTEHHQDTTSVTVHGEYANQPDINKADRPPRITYGYNKDHRPDLKQLLYSITISADGAVPVHAKIYDGNTTDDAVHIDTWSFLHKIIGHSDFLYVADSKLCTRENMSHIDSRKGRFLTVMPRTRNEAGWFFEYVQDHAVEWVEVHRQPNPRKRTDVDVVYHGVESPQRSSEGYRVLWYRSSQKEQHERESRTQRLSRAHAALEGLQAPGRKREFADFDEARQAGERITEQFQVKHLLDVQVDREVETYHEQINPGRPGPNTKYRKVEVTRYHIRFVENAVALRREARCDGLFPLMTNDTGLSVADALSKYKYQPFVEKRHEQLKSVFGVAPVWLKKVDRVESLLWLYFVVELVGALIEREVRRAVSSRKVKDLALYPDGGVTDRATTELVFNTLEGHRRHRLLDAEGKELKRFHDPLPDVAKDVLDLLGMGCDAYGIN